MPHHAGVVKMDIWMTHISIEVFRFHDCCWVRYHALVASPRRAVALSLAMVVTSKAGACSAKRPSTKSSSAFERCNHRSIAILLLVLSSTQVICEMNGADVYGGPKASSHSVEPAFVLDSLARDSFFQYVQPGFSPFVCSRSSHELRHPLVLRFTDDAVLKLRSTKIPLVRVDASLFQIPDSETGDCPVHPPQPRSGVYTSSLAFNATALRVGGELHSQNTLRLQDMVLSYTGDEPAIMLLLCVWVSPTASPSDQQQQQQPMSTSKRLLHFLTKPAHQPLHHTCSPSFSASDVDMYFKGLCFCGGMVAARFPAGSTRHTFFSRELILWRALLPGQDLR
jgi:hypothetical protein